MKLIDSFCYITTKIHTETPLSSTEMRIGDATGFFVTFKKNTGDHMCLVTNRHVVENASFITLYINKKGDDGNPVDKDYIQCKIDFSKLKSGADYYYHPDINPITNEPYDLCIIPFDHFIPVLEKQVGSSLFFQSFDDTYFMTDSNKIDLEAIEDVIMIGYPNGLWDTSNNRPIIRKGITATDPRINYLSAKQFLIDCACIEGSSGSPVFQYRDGLKAKMNGSILNLSSDVDYLLLGIQQSIPVKRIEAVIDSSSGSTNTLTSGEKISMTIPINLGYILKAELLLEMKDLL